MNRKRLVASVGVIAIATLGRFALLRTTATMDTAASSAASSLASTVLSIQPAIEPRPVQGKAQLVATCPSDGCGIYWSQEGRTVLLQGGNNDLEPEKRDKYFDSVSLKPLAFVEGKRLFSWGWRWQPGVGFGDDTSALNRPPIQVYDPKGHSVSLQGTNQVRFRATQTGYNDLGWGFTAETFSPDNREFSVLIDGELLFWSTSTGRRVRRVRLALRPNSDVGIAAMSRDGRSLLSLPTEPHLPDVSRVIVYNTRTGQERYSLNHTGNIYAQFSPDGKVLMVGESPGGGQLKLWFYDAAAGRKLWMWRVGFDFYPTMIPHKNEVVVGRNRGLEVRDLLTGRVKHILRGPDSSGANLTPSPDGSRLWSNQNGKTIWSWNLS